MSSNILWLNLLFKYSCFSFIQTRKDLIGAPYTSAVIIRIHLLRPNSVQMLFNHTDALQWCAYVKKKPINPFFIHLNQVFCILLEDREKNRTMLKLPQMELLQSNSSH